MARTVTKAQLREKAAVRGPRVRDIVPMTLLFLISRASIFGVFPFGAAFFAACTDKTISYLSLTVICGALLTRGAYTAVVKYIIASLLYLVCESVLPQRNRTKISEATFCGLSVCIGGIFSVAADFRGIYDILILLAEGMSASLVFLIFRKSRLLIETRHNRNQTAKDEAISAAVSVGIMITGFSGVTLPFNISLCAAAAFYAVMMTAYTAELTSAAVGGLCIGFITSMGGGEAFAMMGIMGVSAMAASLLKTFGKFGIAAGMMGAAGAAAIYSNNFGTGGIYICETLTASFFFVLTPNFVTNGVRAYFEKNLTVENVNMELRMKEYLSSRLMKVAESFLSLEKCVAASAEKRLRFYGREAGSIIDDVEYRVCGDCPRKNKCWKSDFAVTYKCAEELLDIAEREGVLLKMPERFERRCERSEKFVTEFNHVYELYRHELLRRGEAEEGRELINSQYAEIASIMEKAAREVFEGFVFREDLEELAVEELDKYGMNAFEISIIEETEGRVIIYAALGAPADVSRAERVLAEVVGTPITYDRTEKNGIMKFKSSPRYRADYAVRRICKDNGRICGDEARVFVTEEDRMYFVISDGMGSGRRAEAESGVTVSLLEEFLRSGFGVKTAIEMINSALCLKLDNESFATIDLMSLDLMTGYAEFYKIGSAQSFVYSEGRVESIFSAAIPVGMIKSVRITPQRRRIYDGDVVLMMSDGVTEAGFGITGTEWIKKEITTLNDSMDDMADNVIHRAVRYSHGAALDDMSVIAVRVTEN